MTRAGVEATRPWRRAFASVAVLVLLSVAGVAAAAPPPIDVFVGPSEIASPAISPDGRHLAVAVADGDSTDLFVFALPGLQPVRRVEHPPGTYAESIRWLDAGILEFWSSVRRRGSDTRGFRGPGSLLRLEDGAVMQRMLTAPRVLGRSRVEPGKVLMVEPGQRDEAARLYRFDPVVREQIATSMGRLWGPTPVRRAYARGPVGVPGEFVLGPDEMPAWYIGYDTDSRDGALIVFRRQGDAWHEVHRGLRTALPFMPSAVSADGRTWVTVPGEGGRSSWGLFDDATGEVTPVASHPITEDAATLWSHDGRTLLAVRYDAGRPEWRFVSPEHPEAAVYQLLVRSFPDHVLTFAGRTDDLSAVLFVAWSDREPGQVFLFDVASGQARFLYGVNDRVDPEQLGATRAIVFQGRDGHALHGYLTLPAGREPRGLPLVLLPHGGPYGLRDTWGFDPEVQLLASRGYAVLQVNFRGSGGYGSVFEESGYRGWGTLLMDDLSDAIRWALAEGVADPTRVCVYGASYGGYAALMMPIHSPGLVSCVAGYVGPYDLVALRQRYRMDGNDATLAWLQRTLGDDEAILRAQSPMFRAGEIRVPVFIAHGGDDDRVQNLQYRGMLRALEAAGNPPEVAILREGEGHGFVNAEHRVHFYTELLAFLDRHIGEGRAAAPAAAAPAGAGAAE